MSRVFIVGSSELPQRVSVGRDEVLDWVFVVLPGVSASIPLVIDIDGPGAEVRLAGLYLCGSGFMTRQSAGEWRNILKKAGCT